MPLNLQELVAFLQRWDDAGHLSLSGKAQLAQLRMRAQAATQLRQLIKKYQTLKALGFDTEANSTAQQIQTTLQGLPNPITTVSFETVDSAVPEERHSVIVIRNNQRFHIEEILRELEEVR